MNSGGYSDICDRNYGFRIGGRDTGICAQCPGWLL